MTETFIVFPFLCAHQLPHFAGCFSMDWMGPQTSAIGWLCTGWGSTFLGCQWFSTDRLTCSTDWKSLKCTIQLKHRTIDDWILISLSVSALNLKSWEGREGLRGRGCLTSCTLYAGFFPSRSAIRHSASCQYSHSNQIQQPTVPVATNGPDLSNLTFLEVWRRH